MRVLTTTCLWICFVLSIFSCRPEGMVVRADIDEFSIADQVKIGESLANHVEESPELYDLYKREEFPEMYDYLDLLIRQAVANPQVINRNTFMWDIYIVRDDRISTWVLPGGVIYITDSLAKFVETEAQFMALLSHEMNYADFEVSMLQLQENHSGLILGDIVFGNSVPNMCEMINTLSEMSLTPEQVNVADTYSVNLLCPFNYPADALATLLEKEVPDEDFPLEWTELRPGERELRIRNIRNIISEKEECTKGTNDEMERYRDRLLNFLD